MPIDHFSLIAKYYARTEEFKEGPRVARLLELSKGDRLLDVGGGTGRVLATLGRLVGHAVIADPSLKMLQYAHEKNFVTVCTPAEAFPFPDCSFDKIIMVDAFHHVKNQRVTASELWRVLSPGGKILILEPDIHQFVVKFLAIFEKALLMRSHFLTSENIQKLFESENAHVTVFNSNKNAMILTEKVRQM